jgi:ribosomal protein S18 acetylase RimI-like enzyme
MLAFHKDPALTIEYFSYWLLKTWISNLEDSSGNLYNNRLLLLADSFVENNALQILKETQGLQTVYQLRDDTADEAMGEAVISDFENEVRLHGIFVKPEYRGRGHGRNLMEAVLSFGEGKLITLCTGFGNVAFFKLFGFQVVQIDESLASMERRP